MTIAVQLFIALLTMSLNVVDLFALAACVLISLSIVLARYIDRSRMWGIASAMLGIVSVVRIHNGGNAFAGTDLSSGFAAPAMLILVGMLFYGWSVLRDDTRELKDRFDILSRGLAILAVISSASSILIVLIILHR